ncbi:MAG: DNA-directed RNA polymerase subunit F [Candidatus Diapherotrites archaeon]|nr:DNA-directed RNA polymerase subunit F [Candidatus Diapherotrites archaeon]
MLVEKIVSKKPVSLAEVKETLKERLKDKEGEPTYEQDMTLKYVATFVTLTRAQSHKLIKDLLGIEGIDDVLAVKIADILPTKPQVLEVLLQKKYNMTDEQKKQIVDLVIQYTS